MVQPQMGSMTRWFLTLLIGGSLALSGCSLALSGPGPDRPRSKPPQCDTSKGLVFVDALVASTLGIVAVSVASNNGGEAILPLLGAGVFVASAIHGNNVVNECNREIGNYQSELAAAAPDPDAEPRQPLIAPRPAMAPAGPAMVAMQPATALPSQPPPQVRPPPTQPQPQPQAQPAPPPPQAADNEPWAAFWKEAP